MLHFHFSVDLSLARVMWSHVSLNSFTINGSNLILPGFSVGLDRRWATDNEGTFHFCLPFTSLNQPGLRPLPEITGNAKSCTVWFASSYYNKLRKWEIWGVSHIVKEAGAGAYSASRVQEFLMQKQPPNRQLTEPGEFGNKAKSWSCTSKAVKK